MLISSKASLWEGHFRWAEVCPYPPSKGPPNLVETIVSQTTSYIMSFNYLCWAVQNFHFRRAIWRG